MAPLAPSLSNILSNLRVLCVRAEIPWLSPSYMARISQLICKLKLDNDVEVKRKDPREGQRIYVRLLGDHYYSCWSRWSFSWWWGLQQSWGEECPMVPRRKSKVYTPYRAPGTTWEDCSDRIWHSSGYLGLSSSFCFDLHNVWNKPEAYIFPRVHNVHKDQSVQLYFTEPVSKRWYENQLANMVQKLGLDSSEYSVPLYALEVPLTFSMLVPKLLRSNITVDGFLLQRLYTIVIDWVMLVSIVLWILGLGGTGMNMIISVDYFKIFSFML